MEVNFILLWSYPQLYWFVISDSSFFAATLFSPFLIGFVDLVRVVSRAFAFLLSFEVLLFGFSPTF